MKKLLILLAGIVSILLGSCIGGNSDSSDTAVITGKIQSAQLSTQSVSVGNVEVAYISAFSIRKSGKPRVLASKIKDDGSFKLKLRKKEEYSFVLYDADGNPVAAVKKDNSDAFLIHDNGQLIIKLSDTNNDNKPEIVEVFLDSTIEPISDNLEDDDNDGIPDIAEKYNPENGNHNGNGNDNYNGNENGNYNGNDGFVGTTSNYTVIAWNDLGMHCMDADFSVFSILPPYNTLVAQVVKKGKEPKKLDDGDNIEVLYEPYPDPDTNSINTYSAGKTNFWDFVHALFNITLQPNVGLKGKKISPNPQPLDYDNHFKWWTAEGIPITPYDDNGLKNFYPLVKVLAKDKNGNVLAETYTVLPVSDEMTCIECHGSNSGYDAAKPSSGWENNPDPEKDYRYNILKLHDEKHDISAYLSDLQAKGYNYQPSLYQTAKSGTPVMCAACHKSNALPGTGIDGIPPLTQAIHSKHAMVKDPKSNLVLNDVSNRSSCYKCHPGKETQCLRGAMGSAGIQCQDCHGNMSMVGKAGREGWYDMPTCQACHYNGKRELVAIVNGQFRNPSDKTFATNPDTPKKGYSLYRFSKGHGGIKCEACHGSTHAIYPSSHHGDNLQSEKLQGYSGTIRECFVCHGKNVPLTANKGPHGMHTIGQKWVDKHGDYAEDGRYKSCAKCHGSDYRGTYLSEIKTTKTFKTEWGLKTFTKGHKVSCYDCHNGPDYDD